MKRCGGALSLWSVEIHWAKLLSSTVQRGVQGCLKTKSVKDKPWLTFIPCSPSDDSSKKQEQEQLNHCIVIWLNIFCISLFFWKYYETMIASINKSVGVIAELVFTVGADCVAVTWGKHVICCSVRLAQTERRRLFSLLRTLNFKQILKRSE